MPRFLRFSDYFYENERGRLCWFVKKCESRSLRIELRGAIKNVGLIECALRAMRESRLWALDVAP